MIPKMLQTKERPNYKIFVPFPLLPFSHIWNPQKDKIITKEHLKKFLEEGFLYNFKIGGPYFVFVDESNYSPSSEFIYTYSRALFSYLLEKELIPLRSKWWEHNIDFIIDSTIVYKQFSHLITAENFSCLLKEYSNYSLIDLFNFEDVLHFDFISSKEETFSLYKKTIPFEVEDKELLLKFLEEEFIEHYNSKKEAGIIEIKQKLDYSFEELDKYLN